MFGYDNLQLFIIFIQFPANSLSLSINFDRHNLTIYDGFTSFAIAAIQTYIAITGIVRNIIFVPTVYISKNCLGSYSLIEIAIGYACLFYFECGDLPLGNGEIADEVVIWVIAWFYYF